VQRPGQEITSARPTRVLVVDDHDLFRTGMRALLEKEGFDVADSASGPAAVRRVPSFAPDVVLMAMNMSAMSGVQATPLVLDAAPQTSVLMLTTATDDAGVLDAIRAGARGYLLKDANLDEITRGIRAAAAGDCPIAPRVAGALLQAVRSLESARCETTAASAGPELSPREQHVLSLLTEGWENAEIAARLYLSQSTIKSCVSKLLAKLGVNNRVQAATFAVRNDLARAS
jgi:DNA-binding NarL/FixJ family response regulator